MNGKTFERVFVGLILIIIGITIFGDRADLWNISWIWMRWYYILGVVGLYFLFLKKQFVTGLILLGVAGFFLMGDMGYEIRSILKFIWPLILVVVGLMIVFSDRRRKQRAIVVGEVNLSAVFAGNKSNVVSQDFTGGVLSAYFGGIELNLVDARMPNDSAELDISCAFGGIVIRVPRDWKVVSEIRPVFGGFEDSRKFHTDTPSPKVLYLRGSVALGGVEVK